jgi:uncharacterized protein DUF2800
LRRNALAIAGVYEDDSGVHTKSNRFAKNTIEGVEADLDMLDQLEEWVRSRRALAHEMAMNGMKFDHHVLVKKVGHRKYKLPDAEMAEAIRARIGETDIFEKKLKSPAALERAVGKSAVEVFLGDLIDRPVIGTDLIRSTHTERTAAKTLVDLLFSDTDETMETYDGPGK